MKYRVETNPFSKDRYTPEQREMLKNANSAKIKRKPILLDYITIISLG